MEPVETSGGHRRAQPPTVDPWVEADGEDLSQPSVVVDLGDTESGESVVVLVEADAVGAHAGFGQLRGEGLGIEIALIGVVGEGEVVQLAERLVVDAGDEGSAREGRDVDGERDSHLVQRTERDEPVVGGDLVVPLEGRFAPDLDRGVRRESTRLVEEPHHAVEHVVAGVAAVIRHEGIELDPPVVEQASQIPDRVTHLAEGDDAGEATGAVGQLLRPPMVEAVVAEIQGHGVVEQVAGGADGGGVGAVDGDEFEHLVSLRAGGPHVGGRPVGSRAMARPRTPKGRARRVNELLALDYPDAVCELDHENAFQLLVATILSAQATDVGVNKVTPGLFARFPDAESLAEANLDEVESLIGSLGLFRNKAKSITRCAQQLVERHGGDVPTSMKDLTALAGVGRKTANVVRSVALDLPGLPVDTHVLRLSGRLELTEETDPVKVELALNPMIPAAERGTFSLRMILHGRRVCGARSPRCEDCSLAWFCPSSRVPG